MAIFGEPEEDTRDPQAIEASKILTFANAYSDGNLQNIGYFTKGKYSLRPNSEQSIAVESALTRNGYTIAQLGVSINYFIDNPEKFGKRGDIIYAKSQK